MYVHSFTIKSIHLLDEDDPHELSELLVSDKFKLWDYFYNSNLEHLGAFYTSFYMIADIEVVLDSIDSVNRVAYGTIFKNDLYELRPIRTGNLTMIIKKNPLGKGYQLPFIESDINSLCQGLSAKGVELPWNFKKNLTGALWLGQVSVINQTFIYENRWEKTRQQIVKASAYAGAFFQGWSRQLFGDNRGDMTQQ